MDNLWKTLTKVLQICKKEPPGVGRGLLWAALRRVTGKGDGYFGVLGGLPRRLGGRGAVSLVSGGTSETGSGFGAGFFASCQSL